MTDENKAEGPLSFMDGVEKLRQSRQPQEETVTEEVEDQANVEEEAVAESEAEAEEVEEEDQPEAETDEEAEPQLEDVYEIEGIEFTAAELKEMKEGALRQADYTKKTQDLAKEKAEVASRRQQFDAEVQQVQAQIQQQHAQLEEALTTFAIEQDPQPKVADFKNWDEFAQAQQNWEQRAHKRQEAQQLYQALKAEQHQNTVQREFSALLSKRPDWADQKVFQEQMAVMGETASRYGYSPEEFAAISDHRIFLALADLRTLAEGANNSDQQKKAAEKKVVKAVKRLSPTAKQNPITGSEKKVREANSRLKKSGSRNDAVAALRARREASGG